MSIIVKNLRKIYGPFEPLKDVNATINDGDVISVIGPSGCGKSTFIRCLNMIETPTSGSILVDGEDVTASGYNLYSLRKKVGMVFQSFNLFEHLTIVENIMLALTDIKRLSRQEAYDIAVAQLTRVGLADKLLSYPDELSGGQRQRASIARALAVDPEVLLLDEPTSALDPTMVREVENVIKDLAKSGKTMVIVTHEMRFARAISNRVFYLDQGVLYEEGTPWEIFDNPKRERTKAFVNNLKVFKYKFRVSEFDYIKLNNMFREFAEYNQMTEHRYLKAKKVLTWFSTEIVPCYVKENSLFHIINEYDELTSSVKTLIYCSAGGNDKNEMAEKIKKGLLESTSDVLVEDIEDKDYELKITCSL